MTSCVSRVMRAGHCTSLYLRRVRTGQETRLARSCCRGCGGVGGDPLGGVSGPRIVSSLICLKRSVASSTFVGLRSGWYINANFRKAFLIDASSAVSGSPRALRCFVLADCAMAAAPSLSYGAAQGRVAAAPRRRAPSDGQIRWLVRLIDRWRGTGPGNRAKCAALHRLPLGPAPVARGRDASMAPPRGLVDVS